jgi:hypothetical protein
MELVDIARVLLRQRLGLVLAVALAVLAGLSVAYRISLSPPALSPRVTTSSAAQTRLLLDAPAQPPTVDLDSGVADTLGLRAGLLADEMATDPVREAIARRAGIAASDLAVLPPSSQGPPPLAVPIAVESADAARLTSEPYVLSLAADPQIPIVSFSVGAPDVATARRIARAATESYQQLVAAGATPRFRFSVVRLGEIRTITTIKRRSPVLGAVAAFVVLILAAAGLVLLGGVRARVARSRRSAALAAG